MEFYSSRRFNACNWIWCGVLHQDGRIWAQWKCKIRRRAAQLVSEPTPGTEATSTPQSVDRTPSPTPSMTPTATPSASPQGTEANAPGDVLMSPTPQMGKENVYYMLKDYFGKIAIYKVYPSGESTLMSIVDIDINSLPEKDREHLQKGIGVTTEEEMLQLIEDYMS